MIKRLAKILLIIIIVLSVFYFLGPKVESPDLDKTLPEVTSDLMQLEKEINQREASIENLKPDNEARIVWFDSIPQKTKYSIVYLHGWSASQEEGDPLHQETAKRFGCNLYLPRLAGHGLDENENMLHLTATDLLNSAKEAIAVGKKLGDKVILMTTSTGGTLALHLAGGDEDIAGLILYSPNIEIFDPNAKLLAKNWGLQMAKMVDGDDYYEFGNSTPIKNQYWTTKYRLEALVQLQALLESTMVEETYEKITQPVFIGYYYRDEVHQDSTVSVAAMLEMFDDLGTNSEKKSKKAFPKSGDHVLASYITSKDLESVRTETFRFLEETLGMQVKIPVKGTP